MLFVVGLYFPNSVSGKPSANLTVIGYAVCMFLLFVLSATAKRSPGPLEYCFALAIVPCVMVATFTSPLSSYTPGALGPYAVMTALFILNVQDIQAGALMRRLLASVNVVSIVAGFGIVA